MMKSVLICILKLIKYAITISHLRDLMVNRQHFKKTIRIRIHKPIIKTFKRHKVYSSFKYKIWGDDLADMQLIDK